MSNSTDKWDRKIAILASIKGAANKRARALGQMRMSGNEWVRAQVELGMLPKAVLSKLNPTPNPRQTFLGAR